MSRAETVRNQLPGRLAQLAVVGLGVWMVWFGLRARQVAVAQGAWPTATATIQSQEMIYREETDPELKLVCRYELHGEQIEASLYTTLYGDPATVPTRYRPGTSLVVYYDPQDPHSILLRPGERLAWYGVVGMGAFLILFAGGFFLLHTVPDLMLWYAARRARRQLPQLRAAIAEMEDVVGKMRREVSESPSPAAQAELRVMEAELERAQQSARELQASFAEFLADD